MAVLDGTHLIQQVAGALAQVCDDVIAVARPGQDTSGWPVLRTITDDPALPECPLRGIVAGLSATRRPWAFVVPCDAPRVQPNLLRLLYRLREHECAAVVARWDGYVQPLIALYHRTCLEPFRELLEAGERSPRRALGAIRHVVVDEAACREVDPTGLSFVNVNRPEDFNRLPSAAVGHRPSSAAT